MDDLEHPGWKDLGQVRGSYDTTCLPRTVEELAEILRDVLGGQDGWSDRLMRLHGWRTPLSTTLDAPA